jgi:hypothetical protein
MTPDEQTLLQRFLQDLTQTRAGPKDQDADAMIGQALGSSPDAAYVLVQHAILSDQALHAAQDQIAQLQDQLRSANLPAPAPARFLGGPSPWAQAAGAPPQDQYAPAPTQAPPAQGGFFGPGPFARSGGLGSFLRSAGTTAAGIAGGALLFDGISSLFGGGRGGFGGFGGGFGGQPGEVVENNYYGDQGGGAGGDIGGGSYGGNAGGGSYGGGDGGGAFDT